MAPKKPRTPPPPKGKQPPRVQAPRTRQDDAGRRHGRALYWVAGVGAAVLVAVILAVVLTGGSSSKKVGDLMASAGCTYKTVNAYVPKGQGVHIPSLTKKLPWNTDPPSNGQHYPVWAVWGFYTEPINPHMVVHNEEHGGVVLWWGSKVPQATVEALKQLYDEQPVGVFGTPYPKLGTKVAITAWTGNPVKYGHANYYGQGHVAVCPRYTSATAKAFRAFRNAYRGHGPEGVPLSADKPGEGPQSQ